MVILLLVSTSFLPDALVVNLEGKFTSCKTDELQVKENLHILVLGAGYTNDDRFQANDQLSEEALVRLSEGIRILNKTKGSTLVTSGWSGRREDVPQAEVLAKTAILLGVDSARVVKQILPENTRMEATEYKRLFGDTAPLVIVTSAIHMYRAMYWFQKAGLNPIPAPTCHLVKKGKKSSPWYWIPSSNNIRKMESAMHEYAGIVWAHFEK
ncbi:MAG: YdcF family protein [Prolixibacteraceae bacterium]|nr:YdcF family protein [Prolixibacteraceae bacterium]